MSSSCCGELTNQAAPNPQPATQTTRVSAYAKTPKPARAAAVAILADRPDNYPLADAVRVGDQASTCGFSARLNRSQSRYHRGPDRPHRNHLNARINARLR